MLTVGRRLHGMHPQERQTRTRAALLGVVLLRGGLSPGEVLLLEGQHGAVVTVILGIAGYAVFLP